MTKQIRVILIVLAITLTQMMFAQTESRIDLRDTIINPEGNVANLIDEQSDIIGKPTGKPIKGWEVDHIARKKLPLNVDFDLKEKKNLSHIWIFDTNGSGELAIYAGETGNWNRVTTYDCKKYQQWVKVPLDVSTRYLRISKVSSSANISEIAIYEYTPEAYAASNKRKHEAAIKEAAHQKELAKATKEAKDRPLVDLGAPYGKAYLVDQVDCAKTAPNHMFADEPAGISKVSTILGKECRTIVPIDKSGSYFTYRIGKMKLLKPGARYLLVVEYPADKSRTIIVVNNGNEASRGFRTGRSVGDALHPKYVNNNVDSLNIPLSEKWERWTQLFQLHDRFTEYNKLPRGAKPRTLIPEDGFNVTIAQFSKENLPLSAGVAVSKISLYSIPEPENLTLEINYPPAPLPRRRLLWREEMADGVLGGKERLKDKDNPGNIGWGISNFLDWYKFKAERMQFLGMNTYTKDLLEFGHNQGWDSTPYGGNNWVFQSEMNYYWPSIAKMMGEYGFEVLPYYEYAGSRGYKGLGVERRCEPLNRTDGYYTHIKWVEQSTADITDPDTYADFKKMLDLTVINEKEKVKFAGIWLRPRGQIPISFAPATIKRFVDEVNDGKIITKKNLQTNKDLYNRYIAWWQLKRREFLVSMRQYLIEKGLTDPIVLFTGDSSEPGRSLKADTPVMVADSPEIWGTVLDQPEQTNKKGEKTKVLSEKDVVENDMYLNALLSPGKNWGPYEVHHARPADDPKNYHDTEGVMITHGFNRRYTVLSPKTFDTFRTKDGLAMVRHFSLNENMMFNDANKSSIGYFCSDIERTGPYCMMSEAIAMITGNPTLIGYLSGTDYHRGFPEYVRNFNAAYLSLPALPSEPLTDACADKNIAVRQIHTENNGTYVYAVNMSYQNKSDIEIKLPAGKEYYNASTGQKLIINNGTVSLTMYPYQMVTFLVK
jgi:hypothetical protein